MEASSAGHASERQPVDEVDLGDSGKFARRVVNGWDALYYSGLFYSVAGIATTDYAVTVIGLGLSALAGRNFARYSRSAWRAYIPAAVLSAATLAILVTSYSDVLISRSDSFSAMRRGRIPSFKGLLTVGVFAAVALVIPIIRGCLAVPRLLKCKIPPHGSALTNLLESANSFRSIGPSNLLANARCVLCAAATLATAAGFVVLALYLQRTYLDDSLSGTRIANLPLFITVLVTFGLYLLARRFLQPDAKDLMKSDARPPVVLLRSFADDAIQMPTKGKLAGYLRLSYEVDYTIASSANPRPFGFQHLLDEALAAELSGYGPFISIGDPNEIAPLLGSAKSYHAHESWQAAIIDWVKRASVIVLVAGRSEGVKWELREIVARDRHDRLVIVLAPNSFEERFSRWRSLCREFESTPWGAALGMVRIADVRVATLRPGGQVQVIRSEDDHTIDYELALRLGMRELLRQDRTEQGPRVNAS